MHTPRLIASIPIRGFREANEVPILSKFILSLQLRRKSCRNNYRKQFTHLKTSINIIFFYLGFEALVLQCFLPLQHCKQLCDCSLKIECAQRDYQRTCKERCKFKPYGFQIERERCKFKAYEFLDRKKPWLQKEDALRKGLKEDGLRKGLRFALEAMEAVRATHFITMQPWTDRGNKKDMHG